MPGWTESVLSVLLAWDSFSSQDPATFKRKEAIQMLSSFPWRKGIHHLHSPVLHYRLWNISLYYFPHQEHTSAGLLGKKWGCPPLTTIINSSGPPPLSASPAATRKIQGSRIQFHSVSCGILVSTCPKEWLILKNYFSKLTKNLARSKIAQLRKFVTLYWF